MSLRPSLNLSDHTLFPPHFLGLTVEDIEANEQIDPNGEDDELYPYYEIKSLLWIKQSTVFGTALEEWNRKVRLLSDRVDEHEKRRRELANEIFQIIGFFWVFHGVVLTVVAILACFNVEYHNCKRVWSPVALSVLLWACTIVGLWQRFSLSEAIFDDLVEEDEARREAVKRAQLLRNLGNRFRFKDLKEKQRRESPKLYWNLSSHFWINRFGVAVIMLSVLTGIFIASHFMILCDRGLGP